MPPAAQAFNSCAHTYRSRMGKRSSSSPPHANLKKFRKDSKHSLEFTEVRIARQLRALDECDENESVTPVSKKIHGKGRTARMSKQEHIDGDENIAVSGDEDDNDGIDRADFPRDEYGEESPDDEDVPAALQRKKMFYIVQNDGLPAEAYRTDLIHRLRNCDDSSEDSDDDCGPGNGLLRLTDRWREEWNHGVQVPMNATKLPTFETAPNDVDIGPITKKPFSMPCKYVGIQPGASRGTDVSKDVQIPMRRLYQGDRLDELWLTINNESRKLTGSELIPMKVFLSAMNSFEIASYEYIHQELLSKLHKGSVAEEDVACDICKCADSETDDLMVFCGTCNVCVHLSCYGLVESDLPEDKNEEWVCMKCALWSGPPKDPPCLLCPMTGGALKCTGKMKDKTHRWVHIACALWIPECRFGDVDKREQILNVEGINVERWHLKCSICDTRQGACIQCTFPSCRTAFHVTCALSRGLEMRIDSDPDPSVDTVRFISLCTKHKHKKEAELYSKSLSIDTTKVISDDDSDSRENNDELRYSERTFYLCVDYEKISKEIRVPLPMVSDVYEYWKQKRWDNGGKPLIQNPQDEIKLYSTNEAPNLPTLSPRSRARMELPSSNSHETTNLRNSLDMGRNFLHVVLQRERELNRLLTIDGSIITNIWEQTLAPVPLSNRAMGLLSGAILSIMSSDIDNQTINAIDEPKLPLLPVDERAHSVKIPTEQFKGRVSPTADPSPTKDLNMSLRTRRFSTTTVNNGSNIDSDSVQLNNVDQSVDVPSKERRISVRLRRSSFLNNSANTQSVEQVRNESNTVATSSPTSIANKHAVVVKTEPIDSPPPSPRRCRKSSRFRGAPLANPAFSGNNWPSLPPMLDGIKREPLSPPPMDQPAYMLSIENINAAATTSANLRSSHQGRRLIKEESPSGVGKRSTRRSTRIVL